MADPNSSDLPGTVNVQFVGSSKPDSKGGRLLVEIEYMSYGSPTKIEALRDRLKVALDSITDDDDPLDASAAVIEARKKFVEAAWESLSALHIATVRAREVRSRKGKHLLVESAAASRATNGGRPVYDR